MNSCWSSSRGRLERREGSRWGEEEEEKSVPGPSSTSVIAAGGDGSCIDVVSRSICTKEEGVMRVGVVVLVCELLYCQLKRATEMVAAMMKKRRGMRVRHGLVRCWFWSWWIREAGGGAIAYIEVMWAGVVGGCKVGCFGDGDEGGAEQEREEKEKREETCL
jgi:hypothetical protein